MKFSLENNTNLLNLKLRIIADFKVKSSLKSAIMHLNRALNDKIILDEYNTKKSDNISRILMSDNYQTLISSFINYNDFRLYIINLLNWIKSNATTEDFFKFTIDLKVDTNTNFNKTSFIIDFDEPYVYNNIINSKNGIKTQSIKRINSLTGTKPDIKNITEYNIMNDEYSGITFSKLKYNYIRMQYINGKYCKNEINKILILLENFIKSYIYSINKFDFNKNEINAFNRIIDDTNKIPFNISDYESFKSKFKNVRLTIDLSDNKEIVKSYFNIIKPMLTNILLNVDKLFYNSKFNINYDSDLGVIQLNKCKLKFNNINENNLDYIEFIECDINGGNFKNCSFYETSLQNCKFNNCGIFDRSKIDKSIFIDSYLDYNSYIKNSEINGLNTIIDGKVEDSIIMYATLGDDVILINSNVIKYNNKNDNR